MYLLIFFQALYSAINNSTAAILWLSNWPSTEDSVLKKANIHQVTWLFKGSIESRVKYSLSLLVSTQLSMLIFFEKKKQNLTLMVISSEIYETHQRLIS